MAFTQLTSGQGPQTPNPNYTALMEGASQAEGYRAQGVKTKADMISEGLKTFDKNQQLLSTALGAYRGALQASPDFKSAVELEITNGTDLGKNFEQMSKGNVSLPAALAAQSFAESYGVGKAAQAESAYKQSIADKNIAETNALNTSAVVEGTVLNFMYNHHDVDGRLDLAGAMTALQKITPEVILRKLGMPADTENAEASKFVQEFRNKAGKYIQQQHDNDNLKEPAFVYELKEAANGDQYVVNEKGDITTFRAPKKGEDNMAVFESNLKKIEKNVSDGLITVTQGDSMKNRLIYAFQSKGLGLDTSAGYAGFLTNTMDIPMFDINGKINPVWIKTWTLLATANQNDTETLAQELIEVAGYGDQGTFGDIPASQRPLFLNTLLSVLDRVSKGELTVDELVKELGSSRPIPEPMPE
jgi:hypothetical protein